MNYFDIILLIPLLWGLYKGFTKGLIVEAASFLALGLGVWGAMHFSEGMAKNLTKWFGWQTEYLKLIAFSFTFLLIVFLVYLIAKLVQRLLEGMALGPINKIIGALFGALKFAMLLSVFIFVITALEKSYPFISFKTKEESLLYKPIGKIAPMLIPAMNESKWKDLIPENKIK